MSVCPFCHKETTGKNRVCDSLDCRKKMYDSWFDGKIQVPKEYLTVTQYAKEKGITVQAVAKNCRNGKYLNAYQNQQSGRWYIPKN
jgi:hypothetical protein